MALSGDTTSAMNDHCSGGGTKPDLQFEVIPSFWFQVYPSCPSSVKQKPEASLSPRQNTMPEKAAGVPMGYTQAVIVTVLVFKSKAGRVTYELGTPQVNSAAVLLASKPGKPRDGVRLGTPPAEAPP